MNIKIKLYNEKNIAIISVIILLTITMFFCKSYFFYFPVRDDYTFLKFNSYVANNISDSYIIEFPYFVNIFYDKKISMDNIDNIKIINSKLIEVIDYKIIFGSKNKSYVTKTLSLNIKFKEEGIEDISEIEIYLKSGEILKYNIGKWRIEVLNTNSNNVLDLASNIPLSTSLDFYELDVINISNKNIYVKDIKLNHPSISIDFTPFYIESNQNECMVTPLKDELINNKIIFYVIKPAYIYIYNNHEYTYFPFATIYGTLYLSDETIYEILSEEN